VNKSDEKHIARVSEVVKIERVD